MADQENTNDVSLTAAVSKAVQAQDMSDVQVPGQEDSHREQQNQRANETSESNDQPTSEQPTEINLQDVQDAEHGKILIRALRDPNSSAQVIDYIARQAGYTKVETTKQAQAAARDITAMLEDSLGEDFKFLAPKLAPAIKEALASQVSAQQDNTRLQNLQARVEQQELKEIKSETERTHVSLAQEYFGADDMPSNVIQAMSKAMDEFPPTDVSMSPERYYRRIFQLAVGELGLTKKSGRSSVSTSDKVNRNVNDSVARNLTSQNRGVVPSTDNNGPRRLSLKDAVSLAMAQVDQASKK